MIRTIRIYSPANAPKIEPSLPPKTTVVRNAIGAAAKIGAAKLKGDPVKVPLEVREARWAACKTCEYFRESDKRCSICGCHTSGWLVNKIDFAPMVCPARPPKWLAWTPTLDSKTADQ